MKKMKMLVLFFVLVVTVWAFLSIYHGKEKLKDDTSRWKTTEQPKSKKKIDDKKTIKKETNAYVSLWEDEKKSISSLPEGLDSVSPNGTVNTYQNNYFGYSFQFPSSWNVDHRVPHHYTRFFEDSFRLDVTYQNTSNAWTTPTRYMSNTLEFLTSSIVNDESWSENGFDFRMVEYTRPILSSIPRDLNHYYYAFATKGDIVYTFQLKTDDIHAVTFKNELVQLLKTLTIFPDSKFDLTSVISTKEFNPSISYSFKKNTLDIPKNAFMMGLYESISPEIEDVETSLNTHFGSQLFYKSIDSKFDHYFLEMIKDEKLPIITFLLETTSAEKQNSDNGTGILQRIIEGEFDEYIYSWSSELKKLKSPVFIRMGNEMNGVWSNWSYKNAYNDPDLYKLAYRHFVDVFRKEEAKNVYFVWNPNENSDPYYNWNHASMYYPGDDYVDWVGMTAYNFGQTKYGNFRYFDTLYQELYQDYLMSYSSKPFIIGEFGSVETGGDKALFIKEMFDKVPSQYPNIKMVIWFNESHPPFDFNIQTSVSSKNAFEEGMKHENVVKYLK